MTGYRGRFAPTPSGDLHLGHARTALVAWLRARQARGQFMLRVEDLDAPRTQPGSEARILADLRWLGLDWDEGPDVGGACGPYRQSERDALYQVALGTLRAQGLAYPCTCSRQDIARVSQAPHGLEELGRRYPGTCRQGPTQPGRPEAWRFRTPLVLEPVRGVNDRPLQVDVGGWDFVLRRADGLWAYQLAVVVDDIAMGVTEVVRGADLLLSTPWQVALYRALGTQPPDFLHLPLLTDSAGQRLAKRHPALQLSVLRAQGVRADALRGWLAASLMLAADAAPLSMPELRRRAEAHTPVVRVWPLSTLQRARA
ncbi:MAG: tRNA glutamyl-Q(34) synthetase GluQRS [Polyangiales bacterium]